MTTAQEVTKIPVRCSAHSLKGIVPEWMAKVGGWTVIDCKTAERAAEFVEDHPDAAMPCWRRWEVVNKRLVSVR